MRFVMEIRYDGESKGVFHGWKVREGVTVRTCTVLMAYKEEDTVKQMKTSAAGVVCELAQLKVGDELTPGQLLLRLRQCEHPVVMKDLCADCGEDLRQKEGLPGERVVQTQARVAMIHHIPELQITPEEAKNYGTEDERNLLQQRRLVLLVDLDQTLIHTTNEDVNPHLKDVYHFQLYGSNSPWYHTRLRPHTRHFLETISKLYELHICTFGARMYAHTVAKILDPDGQLFGHRILSREECFDANLKIANLKALFPCGDRLVSIIDDREDVWNYAPTVVHVKPYRYFKHTGDINAPPGFTKNGQSTDTGRTTTGNDGDRKEEEEKESTAIASTSKSDDITDNVNRIGGEDGEQEVEDNDEDDYLYHLEDILIRVHTAFYQMHDQLPAHERPPDLKSVIPYVKNKVLQKCNIVFSGVVPTTVPVQSSAIYRVAVAFGANVQQDIVTNHHAKRHKSTSATTHLVAAKWGTAKVYRARRHARTIKIVTPQWLWCCVERWERVDERLFLLTKDDSTDNGRRQGGKGDRSEAGARATDDEQQGEGDVVELHSPTVDLDQQLQAKRQKMEDEEDDVVLLSGSSSASASASASGSTPDEDDDTTASGDDEMAEALERVFE